MPDPTEKTNPQHTEFTQASVLAEAAAAMAAEAAAKAAAARARAEEALARAAAIRAGIAVPPSPPPAAPAPSPAPAPVATVTAFAASAATIPERRAGSERRGDEERRHLEDRRTGAPDMRPLRDQNERRSPEGRRTTPNPGRRTTDVDVESGVLRLGQAVRAAASARSADRRAASAGPARAAGAVLEPVAHSAGLGVARGKKRRTISPGLLFLVGLMVFFGMYATGHLPQFDRLTDAAVQDTQAHNDQVVSAIAHNWHTVAYAASGVCILLIGLLLINSIRARSNERTD